MCGVMKHHVNPRMEMDTNNNTHSCTHTHTHTLPPVKGDLTATENTENKGSTRKERLMANQHCCLSKDTSKITELDHLSLFCFGVDASC